MLYYIKCRFSYKDYWQYSRNIYIYLLGKCVNFKLLKKNFKIVADLKFFVRKQ